MTLAKVKLGMGTVAAVAAAVGTALVCRGLADDAKPARRAQRGTTGSVKRQDDPALPRPAVSEDSRRQVPREWGGTVLDAEGHPAPGATIVVGLFHPDRPAHQVITTDHMGRFTWPLPPVAEAEWLYLIAYKDGLAPAAFSAPAGEPADPHAIKLRLALPSPFSATLVDAEARPLAGAKVRVELIGHARAQESGSTAIVSMGFTQVTRDVIAGSPVENLFSTTTGPDGSFSFRTIPSGAGLMLTATASDGRVFWVKPDLGAPGLVAQSLHQQRFATAPPGRATRLVAVPASRISGRVVTKLPGLAVSGLTALCRSSHPPLSGRVPFHSGGQARTDEGGRFLFEGLSEGTAEVIVQGVGANRDWTYVATSGITLVEGKTAEAVIELIRGVEVVGTVVTSETGEPVEGARVAVRGPSRPPTGAETDREGRYRFRLPSGETYLDVLRPPNGFARPWGAMPSRVVVVPEGAARFEVTPFRLASAVTVGGRVVDAAGTPVAGARVVEVSLGTRRVPLQGSPSVTDARGSFRLPLRWNEAIPAGRAAGFRVRLPDDTEREVVAVPEADGAVTVKLSAITPLRPD